MPYCPNPLCDHRKRLGEPAEFKRGVTICSDCGSKLVETIPEFASQAPEPTLEFADLEVVYSAATISMVNIFKAILEQHGIQCWVRNDALSAGIGGLPPIETWPQLCVEKDDYSEAKHIVEEALAAEDSGIMRQCGSCGEVLEGQSMECWNCGKGRLGSGNAGATHGQDAIIKNSNSQSDPVEEEEGEQTLRGLRIFLLILSGFFFLMGYLSLQPGQNARKGFIGFAIFLLLVVCFTYLPKGSDEE